VIYLLDLNYTLVGNSPKRGEPPLRPFIRQLEQETYRGWLVDLLRPHQVILITARPNRYREATLDRIQRLTDWQPMDAYFAEIEARPPQIKEHLLNAHIFPKYGTSDYFGLESNPHTRAMYARYGINAVRVSDQEMMWLPGS
jgi:hypothetical protein